MVQARDGARSRRGTTDAAAEGGLFGAFANQTDLAEVTRRIGRDGIKCGKRLLAGCGALATVVHVDERERHAAVLRDFKRRHGGCRVERL